MKDTRIKISTLIENQIPQYLRESSPLLIDFLRQYYISIESKGKPLDIFENIDQYINIDQLTSIKRSTQLIDSVSFFDTEIRVDSTLGFPDSYGLLKINDEIISYETKTNNTFLNCFRGFSGIESYGETNFEKNVIFRSSSVSEHSTNDNVENLSVLFLTEFLNKIKKQILPGFESRSLTPKLNENIFIKQSKDFYSSKGTTVSFEILFKLLYGEKVSTIRPSEFLIEPSKSNYLITKDIVVEPIRGNPEELINQTIYQNEDDYFSDASSTVTRVEKITRNSKEYYVLSLDFGYDRDLETRGSFIGEFNIHPKTKIIENVVSDQNYIDVDSTVGFPNSGVLVVNRNGIDFNIKYNSKSLNQFSECENVPVIEDGLDIRLDTYAFGISNVTAEEVRFRISGVLSNLNILGNTILSDVGDTIRIISPGKQSDNIRTKNWLYNISVDYDIEKISSDNLVNVITLFDEHNFVPGDNVLITSSQGDLQFTSNVIDNTSKFQIVIKPPLLLSDINENFSYKIKRKLSKSLFKNYPELSSVNSNVQNIYEPVEENGDVYITSSSIPNYFNTPDNPLPISNRFILINGNQTNNQISFPSLHPFFTGDIVRYSYGNDNQDLDIDEGLYYIKRLSNRIIRFYKSREDILKDRFVTFPNKTVSNNVITPFILSDKQLTTQKLVRKIQNPTSSVKLNETRYGSTGIFLNGVEISNYKSNDFVYYGPIEEVKVSSDLDDYDVINPNNIIISDINGLGTDADLILHITGNLKKVNILDSGFDFLSTPIIGVNGGNGGGCKFDVSLVNFTHRLDFNSQDTNSLNLLDNIITFTQEHRFRDVEKITYKNNGQTSVGGLVNFSNYYLKSISSTSVKIYFTEQDALVGINTVDFSSLGAGIHTIESVIKKKRLSSINVINSGSNYSNKKIIVSHNAINDKKNTIFARGHGYKDKEIIYYENTGTEIGGVSKGDYYVKVVNKNEFSLVDIISGGELPQDFNFIENNIVKFTSKGTGSHIFNYPEIEVTINGIVGVNTFSSEFAGGKLEPIFRGKIENIFIKNPGKNYGNPNIINYEKQPNFTLTEGSGGFLKPIIFNGRIEKVLVLNSGSNYNSVPELEILGSGNGAILTPVMENGSIKEVVVVNKGNRYDQNFTSVIVKNSNLNSRTKLKFRIKKWNINNYFRLNSTNSLTEYQSLLTEPLNEEYGLQYKHITLPKSLRRLLFTSKIIEDAEYYISDDKNDTQSNPNLLVHSPIVGWAYDGNPIYGPYGFDNPLGGEVRRMESGYSISTENLQNRPNYNPDYNLGFFVEDYTFVDNGDLDIHNGRFCVTPEFPEGTYAYFCAIDEQFRPKFPYVLGNFYKSVPIQFNFDKKSNQDIFDINKNNLIRNTSPYKFLSNNSNYSYIIDPNEIKNQNSKVTSIMSGSVDFMEIISPGVDYKVGEKIIIDPGVNDFGFGASLEISEVSGKEVEKIETEIKDIDEVQFARSNVFNNTIAISKLPHNLNDGDLITINEFDSPLGDKFHKINTFPTTLTLNEDVGDELDTGTITFFKVNGNLNYPFIMEDDIFTIGEEQIKILSIDLDSNRIKVLRGYNFTTITQHFSNEALIENTRKFYLNKDLGRSYKINRKYYFIPQETIGIGTISSTGAGVTVTFSNPGVGITQTFIPIQTLYLKNHNLNTGDKLIYNTNGGVGIKVFDDSFGEFTLSDNNLLYVAKINENLIGISTDKLTLSPQGEFVGIGQTANILYFSDLGVGINHSLTNAYDKNLTVRVNNIKSKLTTKSDHFLRIKDIINLNVKTLKEKTYSLLYDFKSRNLILDKKLIESVGNNVITIQNHNLNKGDKLLFNTFTLIPPLGLIDGEKYYALPINSNQIKLSTTYFGAFNDQDIVDISLSTPYDPLDPAFDPGNSFFLSLVNPPIEIFKNSRIIFDLSDSSLIGFDFDIFEDNHYTNIFYGFDGLDTVKTGIPGTTNASLMLNIKETEIANLYYTLTIPNKNAIFFEKLEYFNDDVNIKNNNTLLIKNSRYSGSRVVSGIGTNYFEFNLNNTPESLTYDNNDSEIKYSTKSRSALGPILDVRVISKGRNYKKLPTIKDIATQFGKGAFLKVGTTSIGKIKSVEIEDIGFDYFSDSSLRSFSKIPEVLRVNPLSALESIRVLFSGEQYNIAPNLVLLDGITGKVVSDVILNFNLGDNFVSILKNTSGINDVIPNIIPINNINGTNILSIETNSENNTLKVFLDQEYSNIYEFPFSRVVATTLNDVEEFTNKIIVDDSSKIPEFSIIKIISPITLNIEDEILYVRSKDNNTLIVERGYLNTDIPNLPFKYLSGSQILLLEKNVLIENVNILNGTGKQYNSENYDFKLYQLIQITPQLGGQGPSITLDSSQILTPGDSFGIYDVNSSFGTVTPESYFPRFEITLKKNIFSVGETIVSNDKTGIVEFWDSKNELLKINTIDDFDLGERITGKSTGYFGIIVDKFKFNSFYNIDSSSVVIRSWQNSIGFLNEDLQRIHNNDYYQYFSYSLKSIIQYNDWENVVSSLNHTSGFKKFSDLDVEVKNPTYIDNNIEKFYVGIETSQTGGNVSAFANIDSFVNTNCTFDYDLVSENSQKIGSKLLSDQIYFDTKELVDYFDCVGNRVLSIDDVSDQFRSKERLNVVNRFNL
jgi:hypothetical protein